MIGSLGWLFPGDNGITQTVNKIRELVRFALRSDTRIRVRAEQLVALCAERDELCEVSTIFSWVLEHYRYTLDPPDLELVKDPNLADREISERGIFLGDCDDVTAYLAALLWSIGYEVQVVTISIPGKGPEFRHIYPQVWLKTQKKWMPLEATARQFPMGWSAADDRRKDYAI